MLETAVPRYTSYPTAPNFGPAVDANVYRSWLGALPDELKLSLYLHVPYCRELCHYCGCHTKATLRDEPIKAYAHQLGAEIALVARYAGRHKVTHLHWGGGTPSILGIDLLRLIAGELARHFDLSVIREHAIELDPRYLTRPLLQALRDIGVNRASLGVQDFNPDVQLAVGRVQPFDMVKGAVDLLNEFGIKHINFDLMYGLPKQTVSDVRRTATLAHALKPQRVAVFGYAHVPWFRSQQRQIMQSDLPSSLERLAQAKAAHEAFVQFGYQPIGLDHYARPDDQLAPTAKTGRLQRNFQGYTDDDADALIGLGASAISRLPQGFVQNAAAVGNYMRAIESGHLATAKGVALSDDDRIRGEIIERIMCDMAVDLSDFADKFGLNIDADFSNELESLRPFQEIGIVLFDGNRIQITEKGRPYMRLVASVFDTYLTREKSKHSVAV